MADEVAAQARHSILAADFSQSSRFATVRHLLRSRYDAVTLADPLRAESWLDLGLQIAAVRLADRRFRRRTAIGAYCTTTDESTRCGFLPLMSRRVRRLLTRSVVGALTNGMDRLAFDSAAAWEFLAGCAGPAVIERGRLFPDAGEAEKWLLRPQDESEDSRTTTLRTRAEEHLRGARRAARVYGVRPAGFLRRASARPVFVVGSPRSGTSFTAASIGSVPGFTDLGEWRPLKSEMAALATAPPGVAARRIRQLIDRAEHLTLAAGGRPIEQTPESTFLIPAITLAYPHATFVHLVRDGRDVAASLLQQAWVSTRGAGTVDEVGKALGAHTRFWVEPERRAEFPVVTDATRAAWVWRRYESTARAALESVVGQVIDIRYEDLVRDPDAIGRRLAHELGEPGLVDEFQAAFAATTASASGRWRRDLSPAELADIVAEAGELLRALGYLD